MKKLLAVLPVITALFVSPLFLTGAAKTPVDFAQINKAVSLLNEAYSLNEEGKTVKSKKKKDEADKILNSIFTDGKTITANEGCSFTNYKYNNPDRQLELSCTSSYLGKKTELTFIFMSKDDAENGLSYGYADRTHPTPNKIIEIIEEQDRSTEYTGKIKVTKRKYQSAWSIWNGGMCYAGGDCNIVVTCKIDSLTPIKGE